MRKASRHATCASLYPSIRLDGKKLCAYCKTPIGSRLRYCSDKCRVEVWVRANPGTARSMVKNRDHGRCAGCGLGCEALAELLLALKRDLEHQSNYYKPPTESDLAIRRRARGLISILSRAMNDAGFRVYYDSVLYRLSFGHLWEADHIKPFVEGGGFCGLENLQTLCIPCHKKKTARMASALAERKRNAKPLPLLEQA